MYEKAISLKTYKIFSLIFVSLLILAVNIFLSTFTISRINRKSQQQFLESLSLHATGYTRSIEQVLSRCKEVMEIYEKNVIANLSAPEIQKYLETTAQQLPSIFTDIFFYDSDGKIWACNGKTFESENKTLFTANTDSFDNSFVTDPFYSVSSERDVIGFGFTVYNRDGTKKGSLVATMSLWRFYKLFSEIHIGEIKTFSILNKNRTVIFNPDFSIVNTSLAKDSIEFAADENKNQDSENRFYKVTHKDGTKSLAFYEEIKDTSWDLELIIPESKYQEFKRAQWHYFLNSIVLSMISVIFAIMLEIYISNLFHKKDLIEIIYDPLTNLYNKKQFEIEAGRLLRRNKNESFMVVDADIHNFKFINQNFGPEKADELLIYFAKIFSKAAEINGGITCRSYADHFISITKIESISKAMRLFTDSQSSLNKEMNSYKIQIFPKFGITFYLPKSPKNQKQKITIQALMDQATFAKSAIKQNILKTYAIYDSKLMKLSKEEHFIETNMIQAIKNKEFFVVYQPKVNLKNEKIHGAEALVRWNSSVLGLLPPSSFIYLFEQNDFIRELDFYVYENVFQFLRRCLDKNLPVVPVSVNMSRNHSKPDVFMMRFMDIFRKYNLPPELVEVEILERSVMSRETLAEITVMLHDEGFKVSMDDFGSGESSLNMLSNIPVDTLKFDKSFLDNAVKNHNKIMTEESKNLITGLLNLGKQLNKKTLFEGVETQDQIEFLKSVNCDYVQGYYYSKPLSEKDFMQYVKEHI